MILIVKSRTRTRQVSMALALGALATFNAAFADDDKRIIDCSDGGSLASATSDADTGQTLTFKGICTGPIVIALDGLTIDGLGSGIIDGKGKDAVTVNTARAVTLKDLESGMASMGSSQIRCRHSR